jgi:thiamine-monophosphate kinase
MIRRGGAHIGDRVFVSGTIGDAGAGLEVLKGGGEGIATQDREYLISRYRLPEPRLTLGRRLAGLASAAADVSDGLVADLGHIAETSHVRIVVDIDRIPLSCALTSLWGYHRDRTIRAATAGDDYEIAFTAPQKACAAILTAAEEAGVSVHEIGCVQDGEGIILADAKGQSIPLAKTGFTHF